MSLNHLPALLGHIVACSPLQNITNVTVKFGPDNLEGFSRKVSVDYDFGVAAIP